jgi:sugar lactone lactonase YvrE
MAIDASDTLYVTELGNNAIRKITPAGVVTTLAGSGAAARIDATGKAAAFNSPRGICLKDGTLYVADTTNQRIRKVTAAGVVTTLAGSGSYSFADGKGTAASFRNPSGIAAGPDGTLYVCDGNNYILRKLTPDGTVTTLAGKALEKGLVNGSGASVRFEYLHGLIVADGHLVVCDQVNSVLRAVTFAGAATTLAGDGTSGTTDGAAASAHFRQPRGVAQGPDGALYVADSLNNRIRVVK